MDKEWMLAAQEHSGAPLGHMITLEGKDAKDVHPVLGTGEVWGVKMGDG
jgi:hypothetical protein